jgi:hypothetical protein
MPAPDSVLKLCEIFADHHEHFRSGNYNEFQLRKQFLDPLFEALGWDMANSQGLAPQYRDVIHEDAIKIGPHVKAPDYAFTLHGQRKFFLEAKKPSVNIKGDVAPAYQLRRYAWSAKLPLSILSDFEEFAIYDTRIKPAPGDPSSKARVFYCTCDQYAEKWDEIAAIFSRDSILKGSFDKYADSAKKKKGTAEVDTAFLEEIERWRDLLARNFALRNPALNVRDLNFAVQKTIDRLVFLRICEDRGTEDYGRLRTVANGTQTYPRLLELFRAADSRYNSGLFHFSKEKGQAEEPDTLTPNLALDARPSRTSSPTCITRTALTSSPFCPPTFSAPSMSAFSAKPSASPTDTRRKSRRNPKSAKRVASITRRPTSWITSSITRSGNSSRRRRKTPSLCRKPRSSRSSIPPAVPVHS